MALDARRVLLAGGTAVALAQGLIAPSAQAQSTGLRDGFPAGALARNTGGGLLTRDRLSGDPLNDAALLLRRERERPAETPYEPVTASDAEAETERLDSPQGGGSARVTAGDLIASPALSREDGLNTGEAEMAEGTGQANRPGASNARTGKNDSRLLPNGRRAPIASAAATDPRTTGGVSPRTGQTRDMLKVIREQPVGTVQSRSVPDIENPFEPAGIRFGSLTLRPSIEQGVEHARTSGGGGSSSATSSITTLRGEIESDWRRGSLEGSGFLTLRKPLSGTADDDVQPEGGLNLRLVNPLGRDWQTETGLSWTLKEESITSAAPLAPTVTDRPFAQSFTATAGASRIDGFLRPGFRLELDRDVFGDATASDGSIISQADRDETALRGTARLGFAVSPALTPFVEAAYGRRWRDQTVDAAGFRRSGDDMRGSVGVAFNLSEKFNGEASIGWIRQGFDDPLIADVEGLALAAALNWSPQRGTSVNAGLTTTTDGGGSAGGSVLYAGTLGVTHQFNSRLTGTATLGASVRDFAASTRKDTTLSAEAVATWWFNRNLGLNGRVRHESISSSDPAREQDTTTLSIGLRLQR